MKGLFETSMRRAAGILFVIAILIVVGPIALAIIHLMTMANGPGAVNGGMASGDFMIRELWLSQLFSSLSAASWPFIGAALLWRIDRKWRIGEAGAVK